MKSAIELHDSECRAIEVDTRGKGTVILDAYVHQTDGEPGISPGDGGMQRVRLSMDMLNVNGEIGALPTTIYEGSLTLDDSCHPNILPLPLHALGNTTLSLTLAEDARRITVTGRNLSIEPEGPFRFVEHVDFSHRAQN